MIYNEMIEQLKDLLDDRSGFLCGNGYDLFYEKDIQALNLAICYLENKVNLEKVSRN